MKWHKHCRADRNGLTEWICEHGVGHPDIEHATALDRQAAQAEWRRGADQSHGRLGTLLNEWAGTNTIHGCDGCCGADDFPGRVFDSTYQ